MVIQDQTGNVFTFLKYKGLLIDMEEQILNNHSDTDIAEKMRSQLTTGLKVGFDSAIYFGKLVKATKTLDQIGAGQAWYDKKVLFTPENVKQESWYRTHLITEEENKDNFGNKGCFMHQPDFKLGLLFEGADKDYETFITHHNLDKTQFVVLIVE